MRRSMLREHSVLWTHATLLERRCRISDMPPTQYAARTYARCQIHSVRNARRVHQILTLGDVPQLIISQMVCMQALHYLGLGASYLLMDTLMGVPLSLDQFFTDNVSPPKLSVRSRERSRRSCIRWQTRVSTYSRIFSPAHSQ